MLRALREKGKMQEYIGNISTEMNTGESKGKSLSYRVK